MKRSRRMTVRELLDRSLRLSTYVLVVGLGLGAIGAKKVHAKTKEGAAVFGEQLLRLAANDDNSDARELSINGQSVHIANAQTSEPLAKVLARFEGQCDDHADGMVNDLRDLDAALGRAPNAEGHPGIGVIRDDRDGRGVVACFAVGAELDATTLATRLERFSRTHDLGDLGGLRYVAARTLESGATQVVPTWTEGSVKPDAIFPEPGDPARLGPFVAPRPGGARRMLSARDVKAPYGAFLYEIRGGRDEALAAYTKKAAAEGWREQPEVAERAPESRALSMAGVDVLVTAESYEPGITTLSIVEMPAPNAGKRGRQSR